jgi:hypothetical protein
VPSLHKPSTINALLEAVALALSERREHKKPEHGLLH